MRIFKTFSIFAILILAFFAVDRIVSGSSSATALTQSGITFINGVFASGNGSAPMTSAHYQMQSVIGEAGLPGNVTTLTSLYFQIQPGFLVSIPGSSIYLPLFLR